MYFLQQIHVYQHFISWETQKLSSSWTLHITSYFFSLYTNTHMFESIFCFEEHCYRNISIHDSFLLLLLFLPLTATTHCVEKCVILSLIYACVLRGFNTYIFISVLSLSQRWNTGSQMSFDVYTHLHEKDLEILKNAYKCK